MINHNTGKRLTVGQAYKMIPKIIHMEIREEIKHPHKLTCVTQEIPKSEWEKHVMDQGVATSRKDNLRKQSFVIAHDNGIHIIYLGGGMKYLWIMTRPEPA